MGSTPASKRAAALRLQFALGGVLIALLLGTAVWAVRARQQPDLGAVSAADPANPALVRLGRQVYQTRCAGCHGAALQGAANWQQPPASGPAPAPPLDASGPSVQRSDAWLFTIIRDGGQFAAPPGSTSTMPAFGGSLDDTRIWALLAYLKSSWPPAAQTTQPQAPSIIP